MPSSTLIQKARDNTTQISADTVKLGIDEKRVREIIKEENQLALREMKIIAEDTAIKRLDNYTNVLVPKLVKTEMLEAFSDPSIQVLFKQSERTAVCTERQKDYELLSELLIHRIKRNGNYTTSAAIEKAISEVNNLSESALLGLTLTFAIQTYLPVTGFVRDGLTILDSLYGKIIKNNIIELNDKSWIENLEITNSIRVDTLSTNKKLDEYFFETFDGYSCLGLKKDSKNYNEAVDILKENKIPLVVLSENILNKDYVRLNVIKLKNVREISFLDKNNLKCIITINDKQENAIKKILELYEPNGSIKDKFFELLNSYKNLSIVINWWNNNMLKNAFTITPIGKVIAHTNAKSIDNTLPDLN